MKHKETKSLFFIFLVILSLGFTNSFSVKEEAIKGRFKLYSASRIVNFIDIYAEYSSKGKLGSKVLKYSLQKRPSILNIQEIHLSTLDSLIVNRDEERYISSVTFYLKNKKVIDAKAIYSGFYFRKSEKRITKCASSYIEKVIFFDN